MHCSGKLSTSSWFAKRGCQSSSIHQQSPNSQLCKPSLDGDQQQASVALKRLRITFGQLCRRTRLPMYVTCRHQIIHYLLVSRGQALTQVVMAAEHGTNVSSTTPARAYSELLLLHAFPHNAGMPLSNFLLLAGTKAKHGSAGQRKIGTGSWHVSRGTSRPYSSATSWLSCKSRTRKSNWACPCCTWLVLCRLLWPGSRR